MEPKSSYESDSSTLHQLWGYISGETTQTDPLDVPNEMTGLLANRHRNNGISRAQNRTTEPPNSALAANELLESELNLIVVKPAYECALQNSPGYVQGLHQQFLQADGWDAKKAAVRLVCFFEAKLSLFGPEVLGRPILASDLGSQEQLWLKSGVFQKLPSRDNCGRTVLFLKPHLEGSQMVRVWWHFILRMVEHDKVTEANRAQQAGFVAIIYLVDWESVADFDRTLYWHYACSLRQLPLRIQTTHVCCNNYLFRPMANLVAYYEQNDDAEGLLQFHEGSQTECTYSLLNSGIPSHELPLEDNGELRTSNRSQWLTTNDGEANHSGS